MIDTVAWQRRQSLMADRLSDSRKMGVRQMQAPVRLARIGRFENDNQYSIYESLRCCGNRSGLLTNVGEKGLRGFQLQPGFSCGGGLLDAREFGNPLFTVPDPGMQGKQRGECVSHCASCRVQLNGKKARGAARRADRSGGRLHEGLKLAIRTVLNAMDALDAAVNTPIGANSRSSRAIHAYAGLGQGRKWWMVLSLPWISRSW